MPNKKALEAALCALVLGAVLAGPAPAGAAPLEGAFAQDFSLLDPPVPAPPEVFVDLSGRRVRLADFRGRVVLLNFWATWCAPCIREMPTLDRLQAALRDEGLSVLAVSIDRGGRAAVEPFAARLGLKHLGLYLDPKGALARAFGIKGLPATYLIDARGRVVRALTGPAEWDSPEAEALVRHYLDERPEAESETTETRARNGRNGGQYTIFATVRRPAYRRRF